MKDKIKTILLIIFNAVIVVSTVVFSVIGIRFGAGDGQVGSNMVGINYFQPFTIDSNVLMCIFAIVYLIFLARQLATKKQIPHCVNVLYYVGAVSVALTFFTVILFLVPVISCVAGEMPAEDFFTGNMFFFHLLNPILAGVSFILLNSDKKFKIKENLFSIIPMAVYSVVYLINVAILKTWDDFYGFTFGGKNYVIPIVFVVMYLATYLLGFALRKLKYIKKSNTNKVKS